MLNMDRASSLSNWKRLLSSLEGNNNNDNERTKAEDIIELANLFEHLSPQVAPRLQRDYESCTEKSVQVLHNLFETMDLADTSLLCHFLKMLRSFGYFRMAQIIHFIDDPNGNDPFIDPIYMPTIEKVKWYDLTPLLPKAGTLSWKGIMNHGLVKEEHQLLQVCLSLLSQKLHFYSIIKLLDRFKGFHSIIKRNGEKVAEKLFELIRDIAYDDDNMIGIDKSLFNFMLPFTSVEQQAAIIDATIQDLFKPFSLQRPVRQGEINKIYELIHDILMNETTLQDLLMKRLLDHLKCNVIRRKRRHSVEANQESVNATLEGLIDKIGKGEKLSDLLPYLSEVDLTAKSLQSGYIAYWVNVIDRVINHKTLTATSSLIVVNTCSILLVTASNIIDKELVCNLSLLMAKTVERTAQTKLEKLFKSCDPILLIELTKVLTEKTQILSSFETPLQKLYKTYLNRYLRCCLLRSNNSSAEKFEQFVTFVCDKTLGKDTSHLLQYICVNELSNCLDNSRNRGNARVLEIFMNCTRTCGKKLYKFIKRNLRANTSDRNDDETDLNESNNSNTVSGVNPKQAFVTNALVSILRIVIERKDQETLDSYGDLLLKLYSSMISRIEKLIETTSTGSRTCSNSIDPHLSRLLTLYIEHKDKINPYLNYDLVVKISSLLIVNDSTKLNGSSDVTKVNKKLAYAQLKKKLEALDERAKKFANVYQTIINKQFNSIVDQSLTTSNEIQREKSCCSNYLVQMKALSEVYAIILRNCCDETYESVLNSIVSKLETCDPLDHANFLYLLMILEALIPEQVSATKESANTIFFKDALPRISYSLIRISKSVELGPSVHAFANPGSHKSSRGVQCCTYSSCIKIYTQIFIRYPNKIIDRFITDAMQICVSADLIQYAKHSVRLHRFFIQLASAIAGLLRSISIGRKEDEILKSSMPIFLSVFSLLIRCLILASDQQRLDVLPERQSNGDRGDNNDDGATMELDQDNNVRSREIHREYEIQLELLALDVGRMMNNLSFLRVKLVDYAPHLISAYIKDIQRASCPDFVRLHLNEGIFRVFNIVDAHQKERQEEIIEGGVQRKTIAGRARGSLFEMIHARLDQASREIFKDMHDNYNRFHRYVGKC